MNKTTHTLSPRQPLTAADLAHIHALVERDSMGLDERCQRYVRRAATLRYAAALCLLFVVGSAYASVADKPRYSEIALSGNIDSRQACESIEASLTQNTNR